MEPLFLCIHNLVGRLFKMKESIIDTVKSVSVKLSQKQQENLSVLETFYNKMKEMGIAQKEDFDGDTPYLREQPSSKHLTYYSGNHFLF